MSLETTLETTLETIATSGNAARNDASPALFLDSVKSRPQSISDTLFCRDCDNTVRWQAGERLHQLFERRCDQLADQGMGYHYAVVTAERSWTYSELDGRANQLARFLKLQGLASGDFIGLLFDKSVHSYVAMLAVLKIHAVYVPLDPGFPPERIAFIAKDAGLKAVLTLSPYQALVENSGASVLCIDAAGTRIDKLAVERLTVQQTGQPKNELCYIIYTSGSTGQPKGVPIEHPGICNFVRVAAETYGYRDTDRVYQGLSLAFDFAVEEIWVPLISGATLFPNQTGGGLLGEELADFLLAHKITAMCCVPTLLATVDTPPPQLRLLIVSGEACPNDLIARWHHPQRTILNAYGPTETTVTATVATLSPGKAVTIGHPLPTYSVVILAPGSQEVLPFGQIGEIGIAGIGVVRGYLNRDEQTRKAFIPDFLNIPHNASKRIYRSGDLGRINEHGELEYLGRIDTQVKIRGYRIELSEIESVILRLPEVSQAVVTTFEPTPGATELVAYYALRADGHAISAEDMARELRRLLPAYMVPAYYEQLPGLPLLTSNKVDRKALPPPSSARMNTTQREYVEPQNVLESTIAGALAQLLNLDKVSVEDDFFKDLGANSLLMAQFSAVLRKELSGAAISMREIYLHPSVRKLAEFMEHSVQEQTPCRRNHPPHLATNWQYGLCGVSQLMLIFAWIYLNGVIFWRGYDWIITARSGQLAYERSIVFALIAFSLAVLVPVILKWLLIGKWKAEEFPVWSLKYLRFWTVKQLIRTNPMVLFAGTPLYIGYLKLLGAHVSWKAAVFSPVVPVCTDLVTIGEGAVITKNVGYSGYRAESGRIKTGYIVLEPDTYVGEATLLDINTVMEAGSELAHASSLHSGQRLLAGQSYHGSPAQPAPRRHRRLESSSIRPLRMILFSVAQFLPMVLVYTPLPFVLAHHFLGAGPHHPRVTIASLVDEAHVAQLPEVIGWTTAGFVAVIVLGLALITLLPRSLKRLIKPGKIYPLYGPHYFIHRTIERLSNSNFYNVLFGDSSYIVHFLKAIGYRFKGVEQTGSNFGQSQRHDNPFLCEFGEGTMVSDGLTLLNTRYSASAFQVSKVRIGARNFFGNNIFYPAHGMTGDNCLLATKVMVPANGSLRENIGLLGSPCFEIPRSVHRDNQANNYRNPEVLRKRLYQKNLSNLTTMFYFLLSNCIAANIASVSWYYSYAMFAPHHRALYLAVLALMLIAVLIPHYVFIDWWSLGFHRLKPQYCSIYDNYFWKHERYWKIGMSVDNFLLALLNGTPFKSLVWRALGVRVGRKLFDDGASIPEKTLVEIGDYCTLNDHCVLQAHSLEDGMFKSDRIVIADRCTIGANCYVHYGVHMADDVVLEPDSFLMKGESPETQTLWGGNPARQLLVTTNSGVG